MQHTGATILWECLRREGVEVVFGYPGGAILPAYDALKDSPVRHVLARHEQGAAHMADGYARASGRVGVVLSTSGPGATNLVTGLATAMMDSVPLVAVTGQVPSAVLGTDAFQEVDVTGVTLPITKHNYLVQRADQLAPALREAFALARCGRPGPVLVDITKDAQLGQAALDWDAIVPTRHRRHLPEPVPDAHLDKALAMIRASRRPLILAGHGVTLAGGSRALLAFAETAGIPVACTLLGLDAFPAGHPLFAGFMGMHGSPWTNLAIQEADLLLAFGMRFDDRVTGAPATFAPHAKKIHVEIDRAEVGKIIAVDLALQGDLREVLERLLPGLEPVPTGAWLERLEQLRGDHAAGGAPWPPVPAGPGLNPIQVLRLLQEAAPDAVWVTDVGQHQMWQAQVMRHVRPRTLVTSGGLGTMGFALPAAIGAKLACPEAEVWVVAGDGGIQMNSQEFMTLVQEGLKLNVAVLNNGTLGMVRQWQTLFHQDRRQSVGLANPDFVRLAEAYGMTGLRAATLEEAGAAVARARACPGPVLIDFVVDPEAAVYPIVPSGGRLEDMLHDPNLPPPSPR
ncbi:MAG: biosynthetic-type acetolactate synthase large subunit [Holophaga sp.]